MEIDNCQFGQLARGRIIPSIRRIVVAIQFDVFYPDAIGLTQEFGDEDIPVIGGFDKRTSAVDRNGKPRCVAVRGTLV